MSREIEAKLKIDSLDSVENALKRLKAEFVENQFQRDYYYFPVKPVIQSQRPLRLRYQRAEAGQRNYLTYKGKKQDSKFKKRIELELEIDDIEKAGALLNAIGYEQGLAFEKKRQYWKYFDCQVFLDELPLIGFFVEIEGVDEARIARVQLDMGLAGCDHINKGYSAMIIEKLADMGIAEKEVYFSG